MVLSIILDYIRIMEKKPPQKLGMMLFCGVRYQQINNIKKRRFVYLFIKIKNHVGYNFVQIAKKLSLNSILVFINII